MEDKKSWGEYISKKRKELGLTQKEFASKLFVTESAVSKWERGLSYPDITLIRDICEVLQISEHELLTASEDVEARNSEKLAARYTRMVLRYRNILSGIYGLSLLICFICNIAIQHKLSWFFIVLASEMVTMSITLLPVFINKQRGLKVLGAFTGSISLLLLICNIYAGGNWFFIAFISVIFGMSLLFLPFVLQNIGLPEFFDNKKTMIYFATESFMLLLLLLVCNFYTGGEWFLTTALPIALFSLLLPWGMMFVIRYTKLNGYLKTAGCLAIGAVFHYYVQGFLNFILKDGNNSAYQFNFSKWTEDTVNGNVNMIMLLCLLLFAVIFSCIGIYMMFHAGNMREKD